MVALEEDAALAEQARVLLQDLEIDNVSVVTGSLREGYPEQAPKTNPIGTRLVSGEPAEDRGEMAVCGKRENHQIRPSTAGFFHPTDHGLAWDERTNLTWSRCALGQEFVDGGEESYCEGEPVYMTWQEAMEFVQQSNAEGRVR